MTTTSRTPDLWDLDDHSGRPIIQERVSELEIAPRPNHAGTAAAVAGALTVAAAAVPGLPAELRWPLVGALGLVALLSAFGSLRRRQAVGGVVRACVGIALAVLAVGLVLLLPGVPPLLQNTRLEAAAGSSVTTTAQLRSRPSAERDAAGDAARALALRLRAMHGVAGPYPASLTAADGVLVETGGLIDGVRVGTIPAGMHVRYAVATDGGAFAVRVALDADDSAAATAGNRLRIATR